MRDAAGSVIPWPTVNNGSYMVIDINMAPTSVLALAETWQPVADYWSAIRHAAIFANNMATPSIPGLR